jgi:peptidoglycan hydrolase-like protein with peptidoglycan-binding domain
MFTGFPTYSRYRTLQLSDPRQRGEDVFALQVALNEVINTALALDGILGPKTSQAIFKAQGELSLVIDGKAGGLTQRALALRIAVGKTTVPFNLIKGQLEHESGYRLGNYSPQRSDGSYDAGVAQRNTNYTPPRDGFNPAKSIEALEANTRHYYDLYSGIADEKRRWGVAAGAWNAPAYANYLAGVKPWAVPSESARVTFEAYIDSVTAYL